MNSNLQREKEEEFSRLQEQKEEKEEEISRLLKQKEEKEEEISRLLKQKEEKEEEFSRLQKQKEEKEEAFSRLQATYSSEICFSNYTNKTVDVTLDPETVSPNLILSEDVKQVRYGDKQNVPDNPKRFDAPCVLGKEGFSSGRFYYEVQVGEKPEWALGVAKESINRKGKITLSPGNGYWTIWLRNGTEYSANPSPPVPLPLREKPRTVGVYVDYEGGQVSFYNVEARSHIYSFTGYTFSDKLLPYFWPGIKDVRVNIPLIIIFPVSRRD
ncbi:E3 ubiquitin-protein ligase TRIM39-like [Megalops cyprinoides]|uniref:E3 ubiquitin-protein ligase TRIM39-like n=1 Tax=Megalops cyprinoides TaxID=118141 RepID=UPI00186510E2|nr:E3 ubiquitin-protein ligase TRIM39-like [Megalops cyprinoides]